MIPDGSAPPAPARGRFTFVPCCVSAVPVTMKMISNTRKMSVRGVTLISATIWPSPASLSTGLGDTGDAPFAGARRGELDEQLIRPLAPESRQVADAHHEGIIREDRQHAHEQAPGGGDQGFGD